MKFSGTIGGGFIGMLKKGLFLLAFSIFQLLMLLLVEIVVEIREEFGARSVC